MVIHKHKFMFLSHSLVQLCLNQHYSPATVRARGDFVDIKCINPRPFGDRILLIVHFSSPLGNFCKRADLLE